MNIKLKKAVYMLAIFSFYPCADLNAETWQNHVSPTSNVTLYVAAEQDSQSADHILEVDESQGAFPTFCDDPSIQNGPHRFYIAKEDKALLAHVMNLIENHTYVWVTVNDRSAPSGMPGHGNAWPCRIVSAW